ncbi:hypothetical protein [Flavobacterium sp.]|uniref:hypothetical protein n=1 Tax=Flavobacterium sp. TaxID=239 RepID=UPI0037530E0C
MKNYLKFIVAVSAFTFAIFTSVNVHAKRLAPGSCDSSAATCGKTGNGDLITGTYHN